MAEIYAFQMRALPAPFYAMLSAGLPAIYIAHRTREGISDGSASELPRY